MKMNIALIVICMILIESPRVSLFTVWMSYALESFYLRGFSSITDFAVVTTAELKRWKISDV